MRKKSFKSRLTNLFKRKSSTKIDVQEEIKLLIYDFVRSPAFKYAAGGVAVALLAKLGAKLSASYPELSKFIQENVEIAQGQLDQGRTRNETSEGAIRH